jgi:hypothetical protein
VHVWQYLTKEREMNAAKWGWFSDGNLLQKVFCDQVLLGGTCLKLFFASIFYFLLSVLNVAIENMQSGSGVWKFKSNTG